MITGTMVPRLFSLHWIQSPDPYWTGAIEKHRHQEFINLLNLINRNIPTETWFGILHAKGIKRGVFINVKDLVEKIEGFIEP